MVVMGLTMMNGRVFRKQGSALAGLEGMQQAALADLIYSSAAAAAAAVAVRVASRRSSRSCKFEFLQS